jgi:type IV secretory pathway TraG/TraD family ATPase VirD4
MSWRAQIDDRGVIARYKDLESGEVISAKEYERRMQMQQGQYLMAPSSGVPQMTAMPPGSGYVMAQPHEGGGMSPHGGMMSPSGLVPPPPPMHPSGMMLGGNGIAPGNMASGGMAPGGGMMPSGMMPSSMAPSGMAQPGMAPPGMAPGGAPMQSGSGQSPLIQSGAQMLNGQTPLAPGSTPDTQAPSNPATGQPPTAGQSIQGKNLRMEGVPGHINSNSHGYKAHGFLDATSIAILLPTLVLLALIIAAAHKKRLFPWQTLRTFSPPSGLLSPREYERSFLCPPNLRRHGRIGKRNPNASWVEQDGIVIPFGFLARTHLPVTIPLGRLPNKNMFMVAPSGSGKTTLMRAVIKAMLAKPCVIIALEAKANDPNLDEKREGFKYTVLPEAQAAGFKTLYFNPLDSESIHWNPLDLDPITFASSIVQDVNSLPPEEQHWAERDHGYISGLVTLLKWGAVMVAGEDENGQANDFQPLPCNPRGLMRLVNNRRNIVESLRRLKSNQSVDAADLNELTQMLSSIIRTDQEWDKNIQGIRGRLRMFKNPNVLRVTDRSNIDMRSSMHEPTVLIFGAPASLGPDAESLAACFVYQLQQALHTRYGTASVLPLFAFFDEYQTLNMDIAGRLSAIVRGANGGLAVILQNISQITGKAATGDPTSSGGSELKTIFSNSAVRICLHNADESTARFFSEEIGKHAVIIPGISDHYEAKGFGIFPSTWNRIHSQQVVPRVDPDSIKRMEKHHALVYLSPAGDAEFGETKPLMVDLRGIEEIARLHLLHNVTGRNLPPSGPNPGFPPGGGGPSAPAGPAPLPPGVMGGIGSVLGQPVVAAAVASAVAQEGVPAQAPAAVRADRMCPHCGQAAGKGRFCIECGKPIGLPGVTPAAITGGGDLAASSTAITTPSFVTAQVTGTVLPAAGVPVGTAAAAEPAYAAPVYNAVAPLSQVGAKGMQQQALQPHPSYQTGLASQVNAPANGAPTTPLTSTGTPAATAAAGMSSPEAQAKPAQRLPVTSMNPDLSKLGLPQPPSQQPTRPGQLPGHGSHPGQRQGKSASGVEF